MRNKDSRGYKLHVLWSKRRLPEAWDVTSLNVAESTVGQQLVRQAARGGYVLADAHDDAGPLVRCRRSIEVMQSPFGRELYQQRDVIERQFGNAVSFGGGLTTLPPWVRHPHRVRTWVWAKLLINAARLHRK